jgi:small subunit ribosomal protein S2
MEPKETPQAEQPQATPSTATAATMESAPPTAATPKEIDEAVEAGLENAEAGAATEAAAEASATEAPAAEAPAAEASSEDAAEEEPHPQAEFDGGRVSIEALLKAGSHFGHLTRRWNPKMKGYIFMQRNGIHILDLMQTQKLLEEAAGVTTRFAKQGKTIMFVGTKKQAREVVRKHAEASDSPFVVERWLGGMLTNFQTVKQSIGRMQEIDRMIADGTTEQLKKKERLMQQREREKLERNLGGIATMGRLPGALFIVDIRREHIAVDEARKLGIPIIAMVDTNTDPTLVDFPIPANDDALKSIDLIVGVIAQAIEEGKKQRDVRSANREAEQQKTEEA